MICEQTRLLMFLCRNHSEIQIFQVHFSMSQLYLMCFLNFQKCFHLTDSRGKRNGQGFSWMWRFSTLCCACSGSLLPPASKWDLTGRSLLQDRNRTEWKGRKWGLSIYHRCGIYVSLQVLKSLQAQFTVSLFHGIKTKVKNPTKTCVIQQAYGFLKFQKSGLDSLWCFYFLNYFISTPV